MSNELNGKERRKKKVKSLSKTVKPKDPVNYFGSDVTHVRPDPWQGQGDITGCQELEGTSKDHLVQLPCRAGEVHFHEDSFYQLRMFC